MKSNFNNMAIDMSKQNNFSLFKILMLIAVILLSGCAMPTIIVNPKYHAQFTLLNQPSQPIEKMSIIFLDPGKSTKKANNIISRFGLWDSDAMKIIGGNLASVYSNNGIASKYIGHFKSEMDFQYVLKANDGSYKLVYFPTKLHYGTYAQQSYLAILYSPDGQATPIIQVEAFLVMQKMTTMDDVSSSQVVGAFIASKIYSLDGKNVIPTKVVYFPKELTLRY